MNAMHTQHDLSKVPQAWHADATRILDSLVDGKCRRKTKIAALAGIKQPSPVLNHLVKIGSVVRPWNGFYQIAGASPAGITEILSANTKRIYQMLATPMTANQCHERIGGSRQRVSVILANLIAAGLVVKKKSGMKFNSFLFCQSSELLDETIEKHKASMSPSAAAILSSLQPEGLTDIKDSCRICKMLRQRWNKMAADLSAAGLIATTRFFNEDAVELTDEGRLHPAYLSDSPKARPYSPDGLELVRMQSVMIMSVLGEAQALDITLLTGFRAVSPNGTATGNMIAWLLSHGIIRCCGKRKGRGVYTLTEAGVALLPSLRRVIEFPEKEALQADLDRVHQGYKDGCGERRRGHIKASGRELKADVIKRVMSHGRPMSTREITQSSPLLQKNGDRLATELKKLASSGDIIMVTPSAGCRPAVWKLSASLACQDTVTS